MLARYQQQLRNIGLLRRVMLGALVTLIALLTLTSCSIYDPDLLPPWSMPKGSAGGSASSDGGVAKGGEKDAHVNQDDDAGEADANEPETDGGERDGSEGEAGQADAGGALQCPGGFGDCDSDASNGCETKLNTLTDCGDCGQPCDGVSCAGGVCTDLTCKKGYAACDGRAGNGCDTSLTSLTDCVMCNASCEYDNAIADCSEGSCRFIECRNGYGDCDEKLFNGCETPLDTLTDCGACGAVCTVDRGVPTCAGGVCSAETCRSGYADCDGKADTGCETELGTVKACRVCGDDCTELDNVSEVSCEQEGCLITSCADGYLDCDGEAATGCENELGTVKACLGCGDDCTALPGVDQVSCEQDGCQITSCADGYLDCDGKAATGCENELGTGKACRGCGDDCTALPAVDQVSCDEQNGCQIISCANDYLDCDSDAYTGCEHDSAGTGSCCDMQSDSDTDGLNDCEDECPTDPDRWRRGQCGCPSDPASAGDSCTDGVCDGSAQCDGAGNCGNPDDCAPDSNCIFKTYTAQTSKGYFFCTDKRDWFAARDRCRAVGMELLRIDDAVEDAFFSANMGADTWIGANELSNADEWRWAENGVDDGEQFWQGKADGSPVGGLYSNWNSGEPYKTTENCVEVYILNGRWNDEECAKTIDYVCEKRAD